MKETPSADGHTGGVVAGVGIVECEKVGNKLADAGAPGVTVAGLFKAVLLAGLEVPGPGNTDDIDAGAFNGFPLELDDNGPALIRREALVLAEIGPGEGDKGLVVPGRAGLVDSGAADAGPGKELLPEVLGPKGTI